VRAVFGDLASPYFSAAGFTVERELAIEAPVGVTGNLHSSFSTSEPEWDGDEFACGVTSGVNYAEAADVSSTQHPGYIDDSVEAATPAVLSLLQQGVDAAAAGLWKSE
jgi:hypothetical protein